MYKLSLILLSISILALSCTKHNTDEQTLNIFQTSWEQIEANSKGKTVYLYAWAGSDSINKYISTVAKDIKEQYDITLVHIKIDDALAIAKQIKEEKVVGKDTGNVDVLWFNGNTFRILKEHELLAGAILDILPNKQYLDPDNPTLYEDFTIPTDGLEVPWGTAQFNFFHKSSKVPSFASVKELAQVLKSYPNSFTYPNPVLDFTGRTFLKTLVYHFAKDKSILYKPYTEDLKHTLEDNQVWQFLDEIRPSLWNKGKSYPNSYAELLTLFLDGQIHYGMTFNPYNVLSQVLQGKFTDDVKPFLLESGTIANAHFLSIPYNAPNKPAAAVVINYLISPEAQILKADPSIWGDPPVLQEKFVTESSILSEYADFIPQGLFTNPIKEFHSSWEDPITSIWSTIYLE